MLVGLCGHIACLYSPPVHFILLSDLHGSYISLALVPWPYLALLAMS